MTAIGSLARNVLSNWIVLAANVAYALVLTPFIVRTLGIERYGVWSFLNGLLTYSELLYLGLGSALVKFVAQSRATGDVAAINRLTSVVASIYGTLGLACLIVLVGLSGFAPNMFAEPLSPATAHATTITCVLLGVRLMMIFVGSAFAGLIIGHDRYDLVNGVQLFGIVLRFILTPVLLTRGWDPLLTLAWLTAVAGCVDLVALALVTFLHLRGLSIRPTTPRLSELRLLYGFGLQSFFVLFAVKLISYTDTTVIGFVLGASSVALYSLPLQLVEYTRMGIGGFAGVFLPQLAVMMARGQQDELRETLIRASRIGFFIGAWLTSTLMVLGPAFLDRWIGGDIGHQTRYVILFLSLAAWLHVLITQVPLAFFQALHLMVRPATILLIEAAANLVLSILLAPRLGINGIALATFIPVLLVSFLLLPPYLARHLKLPFRVYLRRSVPPGLAMSSANILLQLGLNVVLPAQSYLALAVRAALTLPVAAAIFYSMFPESDRARVTSIVTGTIALATKPLS